MTIRALRKLLTVLVALVPLAAQEEARQARAELELARAEAQEQIAAANRRIDETRSRISALLSTQKVVVVVV